MNDKLLVQIPGIKPELNSWHRALNMLHIPQVLSQILTNTALSNLRFFPNWELKAFRVVVVVVDFGADLSFFF